MEVLESLAKPAHLLFGQAALLSTVLSRNVFLCFQSFGPRTIVHSNSMRAIFAQFVHSRPLDHWEESRKVQ